MENMENEERVINNIVVQLRKKEYNFKIKGELKIKGYSDEQIEFLINKAMIKYKLGNPKKRKAIWGAMTLLFVVIFFFLMPISVSNKMPMIISLIGGFLITVSIVQTIANFSSWEDFNTKDKSLQTRKHRIAPYGIILIFPIMISLIIIYSNDESSELDKYGQQTIGKIVDHQEMRIKRDKIYSVIIEFRTKEGKIFQVKEDVGKSDYYGLKDGMEVDLIYSSRNPSILKIEN